MNVAIDMRNHIDFTPIRFTQTHTHTPVVKFDSIIKIQSNTYWIFWFALPSSRLDFYFVQYVFQSLISISLNKSTDRFQSYISSTIFLFLFFTHKKYHTYLFPSFSSFSIQSKSYLLYYYVSILYELSNAWKKLFSGSINFFPQKLEFQIRLFYFAVKESTISHNNWTISIIFEKNKTFRRFMH